MEKPDSPKTSASREPPEPIRESSDRKVIAFHELAANQKVVLIELRGQVYQLRLTKSGRLVLTK